MCVCVSHSHYNSHGVLHNHIPFSPFTCPARLAVTTEGIDELHAVLGSRRAAGVRQAFIDIPFAVRTHKAGQTPALIASHLVNARPTVVTGGVEQTVILILLTQQTQRARRAGAGVGVDEVVAGPAIHAGLVCTLIDVKLTVQPLEPWGTGALVLADQVCAGGAILAGGGGTLVNVTLTVGPLKSIATRAHVRVADVVTGATILTQLMLLHACATQKRIITCVLFHPTLNTQTTSGKMTTRYQFGYRTD